MGGDGLGCGLRYRGCRVTAPGLPFAIVDLQQPLTGRRFLSFIFCSRHVCSRLFISKERGQSFALMACLQSRYKTW